MRKLLLLVCAIAVGLSLSMPVFAQTAAQSKEKAHTMMAKKKGTTEGKKIGQQGATTPAKSEVHKKTTAKKGTAEGAKERTAKTVASTKQMTTKTSAAAKGTTGVKKVGKESAPGKKTTKDTKVKS